MTEEILFAITKEKLETGLRGFPVGYCTTSYVDPEKGLFYVGKPVSELAYREPIEVIYLLFHGKEGNAQEVEAFSRDLHARSILPAAVIDVIERLPRQGHPMKLFSAAVLLLGMVLASGDEREDRINLIAKIPHLVACVINHHAGFGKTPEPRPERGYMENFCH